MDNEWERPVTEKRKWWDIIKSWRDRLWKCQAENKVLQAKYDELAIACYALLNYRAKNTLNFQLEKLDDYLGKIERIIEKHE
jgi:hypothetical protein